MNEEDLLKQLQQYFMQNRSVERQYDPTQGKVWTDSYGLSDMFKAMGQGTATQQYQGPQNLWEHNDMTLRRLLEQRNKRYAM